MPELRQNLATKEWVVIATERAQRPEHLRTERRLKPSPQAQDPSCPFCPGNEGMTEAVSGVGYAEEWTVRVVRNKNPAFVANAASTAHGPSLYRLLPGEGVHEVIIESPRHDAQLALMEPSQARSVVQVYQERFRASLKNPKIALTLVFKNHGESAGTSIEHPHSQLVGSSVVPHNIRHRMDEAQKYYEQTAMCVFCRMIEEERTQGVRMLADTKHFAAFMLFAALSPIHFWILPKRHTAGFGDATPEEIEDFAKTLQTLLKKLRAGLDDPDYNFVIQSTPLDRGTTEPFHWYLSLVVRLHKAAGFELGSGMFLNASIPEECAKFLDSVKLKA